MPKLAYVRLWSAQALEASGAPASGAGSPPSTSDGSAGFPHPPAASSSAASRRRPPKTRPTKVADHRSQVMGDRMQQRACQRRPPPKRAAARWFGRGHPVRFNDIDVEAPQIFEIPSPRTSRTVPHSRVAEPRRAGGDVAGRAARVACPVASVSGRYVICQLPPPRSPQTPVNGSPVPHTRADMERHHVAVARGSKRRPSPPNTAEMVLARRRSFVR